MTAGIRRYARHERLTGIGPEGQARIRASTVAVVGLGALGSVAAASMARAGVGHLIVVDRDFVEPENLTGQILYDEDDVASGLPKAEATRARLARINSDVQVTAHVADLTASNIGVLLGGAQLVLDGLDNFPTRFLVNDWSVKASVPWIYTGCVGWHGHRLVVQPGRTPCLTCYLPEAPPPGSLATCDTTGIAGPVSQIMANLEVAEAFKVLAGHGDACTGGLLVVDVWAGNMERIELDRRGDCLTCVDRRFTHLDGGITPPPVTLCGRDAVQIPGIPGLRLDLTALAHRLSAAGPVRSNPFLIRVNNGPHEMTIFPDGRAIVKGTTDPAVARSLYNRLVGS